MLDFMFALLVFPIFVMVRILGGIEVMLGFKEGQLISVFGFLFDHAYIMMGAAIVLWLPVIWVVYRFGIQKLARYIETKYLYRNMQKNP